jgi:hypothetical protein
MTLPEPTSAAPAPAKFSALAEEFNRSATSFAVNGNVTTAPSTSWEALMMKYSILKKFKVEVPADQIALSKALFDCGVTMLRAAAKTDGRTAPRAGEINQVFQLLTGEKELPFLPENAADTLIETSLELVRRSEQIKEEYRTVTADHVRQAKATLIQLAGQAVGYAEAIRAAPNNAASFTPAPKAMAAPRKLTLAIPADGAT